MRSGDIVYERKGWVKLSLYKKIDCSVLWYKNMGMKSLAD